MKVDEKDREAAVAVLGACSCHHAYLDRGLKAPDCDYHNHAEEVAEAIATARSEGDAAGYARGLEDAAKLAENEDDEGTHLADHIARRIRAAADRDAADERKGGA